jgi:hypothetical protein
LGAREQGGGRSHEAWTRRPARGSGLADNHM